MRRVHRILLTSLAVGCLALLPGQTAVALGKGDQLPAFQLESTSGKSVSQQDFSDAKPGVLFLFKAEKCQTCIDGLSQLKAINQQFPNDLLIVGVGLEDKPVLGQLGQGMGVTFSLASGDKGLFKTFSAAILPTTFLVGPDRRILKVIQGGGKHVPEMLVSLAENQLQRNNNQAAKKLFVRASGGGGAELAAAGAAYSDLRSGNLAAAQKNFKELSNSPNIELALQGNEGLAEINLREGRTDQALKIAEQILTKAPDRTMANLVKGKALHAMGKTANAEKALALAADDNSRGDFSWQKAEANLALGNIQSHGEKSKIALKSYTKAVSHNPYMVEALSNQGVALKEQGEPEQALKVFKQLKTIHPEDQLADGLLRQAQAAIANKLDLERQKYIDSMVTDLVTRFRSQQDQKKTGDGWTSPIGAVSILGFTNNSKSSLFGRIGVEGLLKDELTRELALRNVSVVDREILDKVLEELKLGSSELANPKTSTKLGKITAAHVLATGSFYDEPKGSTATMRLVETETTQIFLALSYKENATLAPSVLAAKWAVDIAKKVREQFPLKGRIVSVKPDQVIINLGKRHSVTKGMAFNVLGEGEVIDLGDGEIEYDHNPLGKIEVTRVEDKLAYGKILSIDGTWAKQQKVIVAQ